MHVVILIEKQFNHHLKMFAAGNAILEKISFLMVFVPTFEEKGIFMLGVVFYSGNFHRSK